MLFLRNSHNYAYVQYFTLLIYINSLACALISIIVCVYVFSTLHMKEGLSDCCSSYPCSPHSAVFRHWSLLLLCSLLTGGTTHYCQVLLSESNNMEGSGLFYGQAVPSHMNVECVFNSIQRNLSIKDTINKEHLSNEDSVYCPNHIELCANLPLNQGHLCIQDSQLVLNVVLNREIPLYSSYVQQFQCYPHFLFSVY